MKVSAICQQLVARGFACDREGDDVEVTGAASDSRCVAAGDLFIALPGSHTDGARFVADAAAAGAVAVACARSVDTGGRPTLRVEHPLQAAGPLAAAAYGQPAERLELVGVTGTNGKTSCTYLLESIWRAAGIRAGVVGTINARWPGANEPAAMTTPAATDLQLMLARMVDAGCSHVAIEVSSHALSQHRVGGCTFRTAIFTNLTRDHLDYHGDEESYFAAKASLFLDHLAADGVAILNADDPAAMRVAGWLEARRVHTFSTRAGADVYAHARDVRSSLDGLRGLLTIGSDTVALESPLIGVPNLANVLAAAAAVHVMGVAPKTIAEGVATCPPVPGRLERVERSRPAVLVDYAHTPDALERTLAAARELTRGRVIVVFGCGGDRDRGKRPMMGAIAARAADLSVVTSDNPRSEEPAAIIGEIEAGMTGLVSRQPASEIGRATLAYTVEADRARAIALAIRIARSDDVVVVAGKGHEDYQEVHGVRHPFDDRSVVRRLLETAPEACA